MTIEGNRGLRAIREYDPLAEMWIAIIYWFMDEGQTRGCVQIVDINTAKTEHAIRVWIDASLATIPLSDPSLGQPGAETLLDADVPRMRSPDGMKSFALHKSKVFRQIENEWLKEQNYLTVLNANQIEMKRLRAENERLRFRNVRLEAENETLKVNSITFREV